MDTHTTTRTAKMPASSVDRLLAAKPADLDAWTTTVRRGILAARRDGQTRYIGHTATGYFIETDGTVANLAALRFVAYGDGTVHQPT